MSDDFNHDDFRKSRPGDAQPRMEQRMSDAPPPAETDFETIARGSIAKMEHGDDKHRQWLREIGTPLVVAAIQQAQSALASRLKAVEAQLKAVEDERDAMEAAKNDAMTLAYQREFEIANIGDARLNDARCYDANHAAVIARLSKVEEQLAEANAPLDYWCKTPGNRRDATWWEKWARLIDPFQAKANAARAESSGEGEIG